MRFIQGVNDIKTLDIELEITQSCDGLLCDSRTQLKNIYIQGNLLN